MKTCPHCGLALDLPKVGPKPTRREETVRALQALPSPRVGTIAALAQSAGVDKRRAEYVIAWMEREGLARRTGYTERHAHGYAALWEVL